MASTAMASQGNNQNWHDPSLDPNNTNVPYLAWRGENIRLEKCWNSDDISQLIHQNNPSLDPAWILTDPELSTLFGSIVQTNVQLEDWSGEDTGVNTPKEVINGARTFLWYDFKTQRPVVCFQDTWASNKAGLGQFKLTVSVGLTNLLGSGLSIGAQTLVMQHQWLAGWMSLNAPVLNEVPSRSTSGTAQNPEGLGDQNGDGTFFAGDHWYQAADGTWTFDPRYGHDGDHPGQLRAVITGTLPLLQDYSELELGSSVTLPTDWAKLAGKLATDDNRFDSNPAMRWDIHDELVDQFGNTLTGSGGRSNNATDPVTNIVNDWSFTRGPVTLWGLTGAHTLLLDSSTSPTAGPFDPNFPNETFLPDGKLDAGDAPMPAARIDFAIAPNTPGSTNGVGSFTSASKAKVYSIHDDGSTSPAKNLFAPFYSQYIPATSRDPLGMASGVDGAAVANNFNGFLTYGLIPDWKDFPLVYNTAIKTQCARTVATSNRDSYTDYRYTAGGTNPHYDESGVQTAAVYTDEHGEARINYLPGGYKGDDFYFDSMPLTTNSNGGCDLQGVKILGTSDISAIARYPYQKVTDPDKPAKGGVTKTVYNLFDKHLSYYPKDLNGDIEATITKVIVAHAQDINGQPFAGETVCFSPGHANGMFPVDSNVTGKPFPVQKADGTTFPVWVNKVVPAPARLGSGYLCTTLDDNGNAVFEIQTSDVTNIDVLANFIDEGLSRDILVPIGAGSENKQQDTVTKTPATVLAGTATTGAGTNGTTAPTPAQAQSIVNAAIANGFGIIATPAATAGAAQVTPAITNTIQPKVTITVKKAQLSLLRLVHPAHAKAYFLIKVSSPNKTAKITVALKNHKGKTISKITKTVAANKLVKIQSSLIKMTITKISLLSVK